MSISTNCVRSTILTRPECPDCMRELVSLISCSPDNITRDRLRPTDQSVKKPMRRIGICAFSYSRPAAWNFYTSDNSTDNSFQQQLKTSVFATGKLKLT